MPKIERIEEGDKDCLSQSERFIAKARKLGLDEREEAFDAALTKVARHRSSKVTTAGETNNDD